LQPEGILILRVSAHAWLASRHDRFFGTAYRFRHTELLTILVEHGFDPLYTTFANFLLLPPVALQRWMDRMGLLHIEPSLYSSMWVNRITAFLLLLEAKWLRRRNLPTGISLYVAARKVDRARHA
jgi:hypothetical protein